MKNSHILFDDWTTRHDKAFSNRKKEYLFSLICISFMLVASIIGMFFVWGILFILVVSLITLIYVTLEWLKVKNHHLIIRNNQIEVTNRFNKTTIYQIDISNIFLELRKPFNIRSGGIIMKFYDAEANIICKYEDMLNSTTALGVEQNNWEKSIMELGIQINDPQEIIINK